MRSAVSLGLDTGVKINKKVGVAYHEAGHAIVSAVLRPSLTVTKVTVVPDASEGYDGATFYDGSSVYKNERGTRDWLIAKLCTSLAGVVSQKIKFGLGQIDDGASSDIETATEVAWDSITNKGLDPEFGPISLSALSKVADTDHGWLFDLAQRRTQEVLKESATRAEKILLTNWEHVESVVLQLLERETIFDAGFLAAIQTKTLKDLPSVRRAASKPEKRQIRFPVRGGVIETSEGPVRYRIGDGIISGIDGQTWPADRSYLEKAYKPIPPVLMGEDGSYTKISRDVLVIELSESSRVDLPMGMGTLTGKSGDFLVDYGQGDVSVIVRERFLSSYDFCD